MTSRRTQAWLICYVFIILSLQKTPVMAFTIGKMTYEQTTAAGGQYTEVLALNNKNNPKPIELKLYQHDYLFTADGTNEYPPPGTIPRSNAKWVQLSESRLIVPADTIKEVPYQVNVPNNPGLSGSYWSLIMVEPITEGSLESALSGESKPSKQFHVGVVQVMRYAVQVISHIGQTGQKKLTFKNAKMDYKEGKAFFIVDIFNVGERALRVKLWSDVYDAVGQSKGKFPSSSLYTTFPGTSARFITEVSSLGAGKYQTLTVADGGGDAVFGIKLNLTIKAPNAH